MDIITFLFPNSKIKSQILSTYWLLSKTSEKLNTILLTEEINSPFTSKMEVWLFRLSCGVFFRIMSETLLHTSTSNQHTWLHRQTAIVCEAMYDHFHSNFAAYIVCRGYKPCEFLGFVWTDCWGNKSNYVITSPANREADHYVIFTNRMYCRHANENKIQLFHTTIVQTHLYPSVVHKQVKRKS